MSFSAKSRSAANSFARGAAWRCRYRYRAAWATLVDVRNLLCYIRAMGKAHRPSSGASGRAKRASITPSKMLKKKNLTPPHPPQRGGVELVDPRVQAQLKLYDEALALFHQQKFSRAKQELEEVVKGPSKELADRARMHLKIAEQRMKPSAEQNP